MYAHLRGRLEGMSNDPDDETRKQFEGWIDGLPDRLETDPAMRERGEQLKDDLLGSPLLRDWSSMLWGRAKEGLRTQAADPESELHQRMTDAIEAAGHRLAQDPKLQERIERFVDSSARGLADQFHDELPASSRTPSSAGTARRPPLSWNCCSAATCSSFASTAPWSGAPWAWPCTPSRWASA